MISWPIKKYNIIYADPPWNGLGWNNGSVLRCPANHYAVQDEEWISQLPVQTIADDTCALFLWATFPNLPSAISVIKAWGFKYATVAFVWVKRNKRENTLFFGLGNYTRANAEVCLPGTKGHCQKMRVSRSVQQIVYSPVGRHSEKPAEVRDRIVELFGDVPRIELFAREEVPGWDCWGDEAPVNDQKIETFC